MDTVKKYIRENSKVFDVLMYVTMLFPLYTLLQYRDETIVYYVIHGTFGGVFGYFWWKGYITILKACTK